MANQNNFRSDVITPTDSRFLASRIVRFPDEQILYELIPASFGYDIFDNIEIHFYSLIDNSLVTSLLINADDSEILKSHVVTYEDDTFKNYIRIEFTRLFEKNDIILPPGDYNIVLNFFANEVGEYNDRKLYIQRISDSRTEIQLEFFGTDDLEKREENINDLREFLEPSFPRAVAIGVAEKIFKSGVELGDPDEGITYSNLLNNLEVPELNQLYSNTLDRIRRLPPRVEDDMEDSINDFLPRLYEKIREQIVIRGDRRIQEDEFVEFIDNAVDAEINYLSSVVDKRILIT